MSISKKSRNIWLDLIKIVIVTFGNLMIALLILALLFFFVGKPTEAYHAGALVALWFLEGLISGIVLVTNVLLYNFWGRVPTLRKIKTRHQSL